MEVVVSRIPGVSNAQSGAVADAFFEQACKRLAVSGRLELPGIGTLRVRGNGVTRVHFSRAERLRLLLDSAAKACGDTPDAAQDEHPAHGALAVDAADVLGAADAADAAGDPGAGVG